MSDYFQDIKLQSNEKVKWHKTSYVLQYYVPNTETKPEEYAHHMLLMYYPFRDKKELLNGSPRTYVKKLSEPGVINLVNQNNLVEPFCYHCW